MKKSEAAAKEWTAEKDAVGKMKVGAGGEKFGPKYEFAAKEYFTTPEGVTLYRIRAPKDFGNVKAGSVGGYVQTQDNLSQFGDCWIYNNAQVYGNAMVRNNSTIRDDATVKGSAKVFGNAQVSGHALVGDNAKVAGNARTFDFARILGKATAAGEARVGGNAVLQGNQFLKGGQLAEGGLAKAASSVLGVVTAAVQGITAGQKQTEGAEM